MANDPTRELENTCMLVSDSNEVGNQLDSKKLEYGTLAELAQDNLFKKYLDMSRYLTKNQYEVYKGLLEDEYNRLDALYNTIPKDPKLRAVHGQVILVETGNLPNGYSPVQWIQENWEIPLGFQLRQIPNCMLRGVLDATEKNSNSTVLPVENTSNQEVMLKSVNVPPHMHHSSITKDANITTMWGDSSEQTKYVQGNTILDMFYNDSMDNGLQDNELQGTSDQFHVNYAGKNDGTGTELEDIGLNHDNMPKYHAFYGYVVQDPSVTNS